MVVGLRMVRGGSAQPNVAVVPRRARALVPILFLLMAADRAAARKKTRVSALGLIVKVKPPIM